jgi:signal transduction histidine kinase
MGTHQWINGNTPRIVDTSIDIDTSSQWGLTRQQQTQPPWLETSFLNRLEALNALTIAANDHQSATTTSLADAIAALTHELRTPLATIQAVLEVLDDPAPIDDDDRQRLRASLQRSIGWILELVDGLATQVDTADGSASLANEPIDVREWIEEAIALVRPIAARREQQILLAVPRPAPLVRGDQFRLRQVIVNLLTNACRYGARADTIAVSVSADDRCVTIRVSDHGIGILPDEIPHIFERRVRGTQVCDHHTDGQGLGLHIAREIVELHAGSISVESSTGRGSTFSVRLPVLRAFKPIMLRRPVVEEREIFE